MSPHLEPGARNAIAFVFSCPGEAEQSQGRPAAGQTGHHLAEVLDFMAHRSYEDTDLECDDWTRHNIWIANAWPCVEYEALTGRSQAEIPEILETENMSRLANELRIIEKVIICSGDRAGRAVPHLFDQGRLNQTVTIVSSLCHLGLRGLNNWISEYELKRDGFTTGGERHIERLRRWAECLYHAIMDEQAGRRVP